MDIKALGEIGCEHVAKLKFRAPWSNAEVEHILSFEPYGTPKIFLAGDAGIRNGPAEAFARQCRHRYTVKVIRESTLVDPPWHCPMHLSLGMLFGWKSGSYLNTQDYHPDDLARTIVQAVQSKLIPFVGGITTLDRLLDFLQRDQEPMRWFRVGAHQLPCAQAWSGERNDQEQTAAVCKIYKQ